ncbi:MAG: EamA family transporter [Thermoleophilaceae bacterium]|nr:EamA family transporter [Thermoleophilaceae bacterium]
MTSAWRVWTALGIVYVVWGSTYLGIRIVVETMPPLLTSGVRFALAGLVMLAAVALTNGLHITREQVVPSLFIGGCMVAGGNGILMVAEQDVPSSIAALMMAAIPLWVIAMRRVGGERIPSLTLAGLVVGFGGLTLLLLPGTDVGGAGAASLLLCLSASFFWALGTYRSRAAKLPSDPFASTGLQMLLGGLVSLAAGLAVGEAGDVDPGSFSARSLAAFSYLVVAGSLVAFTAYVWVLQNAPVSKVATYAYVNPVVALFLGWLVLSEAITPLVLLAAAVVLSSVAVIVRQESTAAAEKAAPELVA